MGPLMQVTRVQDTGIVAGRFVGLSDDGAEAQSLPHWNVHARLILPVAKDHGNAML